MVQRHGEATAPAGAPASTRALTPIGVVQVQDSANRHLTGVKLNGIYYSGLYRALQTAAIAVGYCDGLCNNNSVIARSGFDFTGAPGLENWAKDSAKVKEMAAANGGITTVGMYREVLPEYTAFQREKLLQTMRDIIRDAAVLYDGAVFYAASHGPCAELCALDDNTPALNEADFIVYTFEVSSTIDLVESEYLSRS